MRTGMRTNQPANFKKTVEDWTQEEMDYFKVIKNCSLSYILEDTMYDLEEDSLAFNEERFKPVSPLHMKYVDSNSADKEDLLIDIVGLYTGSAVFNLPFSFNSNLMYYIKAIPSDDVSYLYYSPKKEEFVCTGGRYLAFQEPKESLVDKFPKQWVFDNYPEYEKLLHQVPDKEVPYDTLSNKELYRPFAKYLV